MFPKQQQRKKERKGGKKKGKNKTYRMWALRIRAQTNSPLYQSRIKGSLGLYCLNITLMYTILSMFIRKKIARSLYNNR